MNEQQNNEEIINTNNNKKNTISIVGFILSIVGFITCGISSIVGLILSIIGLKKSKELSNDGKGLSIAGIIISLVTMVLYIIVLVFYSAIIYSTISNKGQTQSDNSSDVGTNITTTTTNNSHSTAKEFNPFFNELKNSNSYTYKIGKLNIALEKTNVLNDGTFYNTLVTINDNKYELNFIYKIIYNSKLIIIESGDTDSSGTDFLIFDYNGNLLARYNSDKDYQIDNRFDYIIFPMDISLGDDEVYITASSIMNTFLYMKNGSIYERCKIDNKYDSNFLVAKYQLKYSNDKLSNPVIINEQESIKNDKIKYCK